MGATVRGAVLEGEPMRMVSECMARPPGLLGTAIRIPVSRQIGAVSGLLVRPSQARWLLVFGHGAGAGMTHPFMANMAQVLASSRVATLRYQFPYMERGSKRPDGRATLQATVQAAIATASRYARGLPLLAGGKSMGGRITSLLAPGGCDECLAARR